MLEPQKQDLGRPVLEVDGLSLEFPVRVNSGIVPGP